MIGTLEGNQSAPVAALIAPPLPGDLEGHLNGGRAVIGKEEAFELGALCEPVGQLFGRGVAEVGEDHLLQCSGLVSDCCGDCGLGVAVQGHPPAADRIDQLTSIPEVQACALGAGHIQRLRVQGHLGGWVPEVGVPGHPGGLQNSDQICRPSGVARFRRLAGFCRAWAQIDGAMTMVPTTGLCGARERPRFLRRALRCFSLKRRESVNRLRFQRFDD